ncbi:MAG: thrombospondin type 3 repeat-containing protein, partial [Oleibacter sp.]|nr:thrombospondin type 3 repeat-containing protein [Thalassolituus sp.]
MKVSITSIIWLAITSLISSAVLATTPQPVSVNSAPVPTPAAPTKWSDPQSAGQVENLTISTSLLVPMTAPSVGTSESLVLPAPKLINQDTQGYQSPPKMQTLADGRVLYVWNNAANYDNSLTMTLFGRFYNSDGSAASNAFQVAGWAIDGYDHYDIDNLDLALLTNGNVVIGYVRSTNEAGNDEPVFTIIDPSKAISASEFVVASNVEAQQNDVTLYESPPVITSLQDGRFVMTWMRNGISDDSNNQPLYHRIFNANGTASTNEFTIGSWDVDGFNGYDVPNFTTAQLTSGYVVIAYVRSTYESGNDEPVLQIFNPQYAPGNASFIVATDIEMQQNDTGTYEGPPVIQALNDDRFFAVWAQDATTSDLTMRGRIFNADGSASSDEFSLSKNKADGSNHWDTDDFTLTLLDNGNVVYGYVRDDAGLNSWEAPTFSIFDPSYSPMASEFRVVEDVIINSTRDYNGAPVIASIAGSNGKFATAWANGYTGNGNVMLRVYDASGVALTGEIQVSTNTNNQASALDFFDWGNLQISTVGNGKIALGWVGVGDGSNTGTYGLVVEIESDNAIDTDNDGLTDAQELVLGTRADSSDSDNDGKTDLAEVGGDASNPLANDVDGDGIIDALDSVILDNDSDGVVNELDSANDDPNNDSDGDGYSNKDEKTAGTNP